MRPRLQVLASESRAVTPAVTHVLTIAITSLLVIGLLATAGSFLTTEERTNAREDLELIGNRLADEVSRVDALARNGGRTTIVTHHPAEVSGGGYTVDHRHPSECTEGDSCLELSSHDVDVDVLVPLQNSTSVRVRTVSSGTFNVTGLDASTGPNFEENALSTGLSLRVGVASDVREDPLGARLTARNEAPFPAFSVEPDPPTTAQRNFFNGSASYDTDGNVSEYKWDVGVDGLYTERGEVAPYWFEEPGRYEIELRTADDAEETAASATTKNVTVSGLEYREDLQEGEHNESIRFSLHNNWSQPVRLDSLYIDGPDSIDELDDCDDDHTPDGAYNSEISINTDSLADDTRDFYFEVDEDDCDSGVDIPDNGLIFNVDQQQDDTLDIDTNVDNPAGDVPVMSAGEVVTIELAGLEDDLDGTDWRLGVSYLNGSLGAETIVEDKVGAPHATSFSVDADGDAVDVTLTSDRELSALEVDHGDNESSSNIDMGAFTETPTGDEYVYTAEDVETGTSGWHWAEPTLVEADGTNVEAYELPGRASTVTVDDGPHAGWTAIADWNGNEDEANVVHESFGDRAGDRIGLGYRRDDEGGDNLTAYWAMDEDDAGTMEDSRYAPAPHDGTTTDVLNETVGLFGTTSYAFTTTSSSVTVPSTDAFSGGENATLTVSTWIHPRDAFAASDGSVVVGKLNSTTGGDWSLVIRDDCPGYADGGCGGTPTIGYYAGNATDEYALLHGPVTQTDTWHHLAFVLDEEADELTLYYDGDQVERITDAPDSVTANTSRNVFFGEHPATGDNYDGYIDETRIYNRALSGSEIQQLRRTSREGAFTTRWKNDTDTMAPDEVNLSAAVDLNGGSVTVTVVSNQSEASDPIRLRDGNHDYAVTGLSTPADGWQLEVDVESPSSIMTPEIETLVVHDQP